MFTISLISQCGSRLAGMSASDQTRRPLAQKKWVRLFTKRSFPSWVSSQSAPSIIDGLLWLRPGKRRRSHVPNLCWVNHRSRSPSQATDRGHWCKFDARTELGFFLRRAIRCAKRSHEPRMVTGSFGRCCGIAEGGRVARLWTRQQIRFP